MRYFLKYCCNSTSLSTAVTIAMAIALTGCNSKDTSEIVPVATTVPINPIAFKLTKPSTTHLIPDNLKDSENSESEIITRDQQQCLSLAKEYFAKQDYARALRAAELSMANSESEEAQKIAMLSTLYIAKKHVAAFQNEGYVDIELKKQLRGRLTFITTTIGDSRTNLNK